MSLGPVKAPQAKIPSRKLVVGAKQLASMKSLGPRGTFEPPGQLHGGRGHHHAYREDHHVEDLVDHFAGLGDVAYLQVAVIIGGLDGMDPGADQPGPLIFNLGGVFFEVLAGGAHVQVKQGHIQFRAEVLPGHDGLFQGGHAAEVGAIGLGPFADIPGADAMDPGDFFGLTVVGAPAHVPLEGPAGAQDALELQAGVNIGILAVAIERRGAGVEGLETGGQDDRAHLQGALLLLLGVIDGPGGASLGADPAVARQHLDAILRIDGRGAGHRLGVKTVDIAPGV